MSEKFDVDRFMNLLQTTWLGSEFVYLEKTESTNSYIKSISSADLIHGLVVLTDHQIKGRGQYERRWESDPFKNLTFSVVFRPNVGERLNLLSLAVAYSAVNTIRKYTKMQIKLKWPNDIIVTDKKLGGLLTECSFNGSKPDRVLCGLGINVNQKNFTGEIQDRAVCLAEVSEYDINREELLNELLLGFENIYQRWHKQDSQLSRDISKIIIGYGEWVQLSIDGIIPDQMFKMIGINQNGELMMLNEQLDVNTFTYEQVRIITGNQRISTSNPDTPV